MLYEQDVHVSPEARIVPAEFTTDTQTVTDMLASIDDLAEQMLDRMKVQEFREARDERLVESLVQDAARAAEQVSVTVRPEIFHVRFVNLPCCSRCAILAGRVYRWSARFLRHPGCDCAMIPTTVASPLVQDPNELVRSGQVKGVSKADMRALADGADLNRVVNVRSRAAGLRASGEVLQRGDRPTPAAIYQAVGDNRDQAIELLTRHGYIRT